MRDALDLLLNRLAKVISNLSAFALKWKGEHSDLFPSFPAERTLALSSRMKPAPLVVWIEDILPLGLLGPHLDFSPVNRIIFGLYLVS